MAKNKLLFDQLQEGKHYRLWMGRTVFKVLKKEGDVITKHVLSNKRVPIQEELKTQKSVYASVSRLD